MQAQRVLIGGQYKRSKKSLAVAAGDKETRSVCLEARVCVRVHSWCGFCVCLCTSVCGMCVRTCDRGTTRQREGGVEPSEQMKDELERARRWMQRNSLIFF